jgi:phage terminase small subunit
MGSRGRQSAEDLKVFTNNVEEINRPDPPEYLTDEQAAEWRAIVGACPAGMFPRERYGILEGYCSHVIKRRNLDKAIAQFESSPPETEDTEQIIALHKMRREMYKMHKEETGAISQLGIRLGLAYSTAYEKRKTKPKSAVNPWQK